MKRIRVMSGLAAIALCAGLAAGQTPAGSAFTYQGRLTENGQPANGPYDFYIHLYDSAAGGTPTNPLGLILSDVPVTDGVFTATLDFGAAAFNGDARWLNIQVRPGASGGFYTALTPRQPLTPAPYALRALNETWNTEGTAIRNANSGFVGVNRSTPVSGSECFGIQSPANGTSYGGMYVGTDSATARPFYGYTTGPEDAWTYLEGSTGNWIVNNDGDRLVVTDTGDVGIGTTSPTARLHATAAGTANVARIESTNPSNTASALVVNNAGSALAVWGKTTGTGSAGRFEISNSSNSSPALDVRTTGTGLAGKFTGGNVEVGGELYAQIGTVMNRATPIAFGRFEPWGAGTLLSSSGNVVITNEGTDGYRVFVVGEGDPDTWTVVTNVSYWVADTSIEYIAKAGRPLFVAGQPGNGAVYIKSVCKAGCEPVPAPALRQLRDLQGAVRPRISAPRPAGRYPTLRVGSSRTTSQSHKPQTRSSSKGPHP